MFKTFLIGIVLGVFAAAGALYALPAVDQAREISYVSVAPNGGNHESFHINIPVDRVMSGAGGRSEVLPEGLQWPADDIFASVSTELFKVRNERDVIIGIAARTSVADGQIDWVVHLPARGSLLVAMDSATLESGGRVGQIKTGTEEFKSMQGFIVERWVSETSDDENVPAGRIEMLATYVSEMSEAIE